MAIDFIQIDGEQVGLDAQGNGVSFGEFIDPYLEENGTYAEVHNRLRLDLVGNLQGQGSQPREMLEESIRIIKQNYSQFL